MENSDNIEAYIDLDDSNVNGFIKQLTWSDDEVLKKLAISFEKRHLFSFIELLNEPDEEVMF